LQPDQQQTAQMVEMTTQLLEFKFVVVTIARLRE
jgi:hypothetical protein